VLEPAIDRPDEGSRRGALRILGAIGVECMFPVSGDVLYGQQAHHAPQSQTVLPAAPQFFAGPDWEAIRRMADLIIPRTETPGALDAGAPLYIDLVVSRSREQQELFRGGLEWLASESSRHFERPFHELEPDQQLEILQPLSDAIDRHSPSTLPERFFRALKNLTADGFYTSRAGLTQDLGFQGGSVLETFPGCAHHEHIG
jgi:gluconate 2-dehydrogenase gamma chain